MAFGFATVNVLAILGFLFYFLEDFVNVSHSSLLIRGTVP